MSVVEVPVHRTSVWPLILGGFSIAYALTALLHSIVQFTQAAFGPVLAGVGGDRPPIAPVELRWHGALDAIFMFALAVMLLCAASNLARRRRNGALMIGLWSISSIVVHMIFVVWAMTLENERAQYLEMAEIWRTHAAMNGLGTAQPFGRYDALIEWFARMTNVNMAVPFIYPSAVGLVMLAPSVRREVSDWN